jgi:hypothetical protein
MPSWSDPDLLHQLAQVRRRGTFTRRVLLRGEQRTSTLHFPGERVPDPLHIERSGVDTSERPATPLASTAPATAPIVDHGLHGGATGSRGKHEHRRRIGAVRASLALIKESVHPYA